MARAKSGRIGLDTYYLTALYRRINGNVESTYGKSYRKKINRAVLLTSSLIGFDELEQTPKLQGERGELYCWDHTEIELRGRIACQFFCIDLWSLQLANENLRIIASS